MYNDTGVYLFDANLHYMHMLIHAELPEIQQDMLSWGRRGPRGGRGGELDLYNHSQQLTTLHSSA